MAEIIVWLLMGFPSSYTHANPNPVVIERFVTESSCAQTKFALESNKVSSAQEIYLCVKARIMK